MTDAEQQISDEQIITDGIELAEATKKRIASDPDAVRKILAEDFGVTDTVTVYPSKARNLAFAKHNEALSAFQEEARQKPGESNEDYEKRVKSLKPRLAELEAEGEAVRAALEESAVTLEFRGLGKRAVKRIRNDVRKDYPLPPAGTPDDPTLAEERDDVYQERVIAAHIQHAGYTVEDVEGWRDKWPTIEFGKLWATALKLSITDDFLRGALDVDF